MIAELRDIQDEIRTIVFSAIEHVGARRGALYLPVSHDRSDRRYELVASYQFKSGVRGMLTTDDPLVDLLIARRRPFFVNGVGADHRLAEILFSGQSDRLLAAPLFARGRMIGFLDLRDKSRGEPFNEADLQSAAALAGRVMELLGYHKLFDAGPIALVEAEPQTASFETEARLRPAKDQNRPLSSRAARVIASARHAMTKRQHAVLERERIPSDEELELIRLFLPALLAIPGTIMAAATATVHRSVQSIVSSVIVSDELTTALREHLVESLARFNREVREIMPDIQMLGAGVQAPESRYLFTAPICASSMAGLFVTVVFGRKPSDAELEQLSVLRMRLEDLVEGSISRRRLADQQRLIAEMLLQPDFETYSALMSHSRGVATLCAEFADALGVPEGERETLRVAALLHDVGLRLLDYDDLYELSALSREQRRAIQEHPIVGAALVRPLFGAATADIILRHHERIDGTGYPSRMRGEQIPRGARILQIADAWVSMTSRTYTLALSPEAAIEKIRQGAGTQFDAKLVERFIGAGFHLEPSDASISQEPEPEAEGPSQANLSST